MDYEEIGSFRKKTENCPLKSGMTFAANNNGTAAGQSRGNAGTPLTGIDDPSVVYASVERRLDKDSSRFPSQTGQLGTSCFLGDASGNVDGTLYSSVTKRPSDASCSPDVRYSENIEGDRYWNVRDVRGVSESQGGASGGSCVQASRSQLTSSPDVWNWVASQNSQLSDPYDNSSSSGRNFDRSGVYSFVNPVAGFDEGFSSMTREANPAGNGIYEFQNQHGFESSGSLQKNPRAAFDYDIYSEVNHDEGYDGKEAGYGSVPCADRYDDSGIYSMIRSHSGPYGANETDMALTGATCSRCQLGFSRDEEIVNSSGQIWHTKCFVCAQCFQQFPDGIFYEFEGRKYCEHDFNILFAPCCGRCKVFIIGRVIKAMNFNWHPNCFTCELCQAPLADAGFIKNAGRALCRECNSKEKARGSGKYVCHKCHSIIEEGHIKFKGEAYHPYHFNCANCSVELNSDAREKGGELYCLRCHDKMGIPICGACRRPIEERVVYALGKAWHVEHFVCAKCEKPFLGTRHYEKKGLAYCETHYHQLFGNICFVCNCVVAGDVFTALNKAWCVDHFACSVCDRKMSQKTKFFEVDLKPVCKGCYEKFPAELKKRLKKAYDQQTKK